MGDSVLRDKKNKGEQINSLMFSSPGTSGLPFLSLNGLYAGSFTTI